VTALAVVTAPRRSASIAALARPATVTGGLIAVVVARWAVWRSGALDPIVVGALFGVGLLAVGLVAGWRPTRAANLRVLARAFGIGALGGLALVATALVGPHPSWAATLAGGFPLAPWIGATVLVASVEEVVLRGALFDALDRPFGVLVALLATSAVFALIHVPVYGFGAVPLDLGVGLVLGGLRLVSGGVAAPAVAHVLADLAVLGL